MTVTTCVYIISSTKSRWLVLAKQVPVSCMSGASGEIARRYAPRPFGTAFASHRRPTWPAAKLSNSACFSAGSSNHDVEPTVTTKGPQTRKIMVRHR